MLLHHAFQNPNNANHLNLMHMWPYCMICLVYFLLAIKIASPMTFIHVAPMNCHASWVLHLITCVDWILFVSGVLVLLGRGPSVGVYACLSASRVIWVYCLRVSCEVVPSSHVLSGEHSHPFYLFYFIVFTSSLIYCYPLCYDAVVAFPYYITCAAIILGILLPLFE